MRLWHQALIPLLPRQQLLGQHRECAALRGNGWGKKHSTVNYVFEHHWYKLYIYHVLVMIEMGMRGYNVQEEWLDYRYRGAKCEPREELSQEEKEQFFTDLHIYKEHDKDYLIECLDNLKEKGINLYEKFKI